MKLKINITKDVLKRSMWCGTKKQDGAISQNCVIALAVRDIFPKAEVCHSRLVYERGEFSPLPLEAKALITRFDDLWCMPELRLNLPEFSFEIDVPESVIESINIDDLKNCKTVELCQ